MDIDREEEPVFDLSSTPLAAGIEAALGNTRRLDKIAPPSPPVPETSDHATRRSPWQSWDRGDQDRGR
ncbi:MAG: hypothetical protein CTY25_12050 [Methylobacterium sp.]|nr:MAG: hypothetical protein CTY25_12050 [Methylobacterium sp.]